MPPALATVMTEVHLTTEANTATGAGTAAPLSKNTQATSAPTKATFQTADTAYNVTDPSLSGRPSSATFHLQSPVRARILTGKDPGLAAIRDYPRKRRPLMQAADNPEDAGDSGAPNQAYPPVDTSVGYPPRPFHGPSVDDSHLVRQVARTAGAFGNTGVESDEGGCDSSRDSAGYNHTEAVACGAGPLYCGGPTTALNTRSGGYGPRGPPYAVHPSAAASAGDGVHVRPAATATVTADKDCYRTEAGYRGGEVVDGKRRLWAAEPAAAAAAAATAPVSTCTAPRHTVWLGASRHAFVDEQEPTDNRPATGSYAAVPDMPMPYRLPVVVGGGGRGPTAATAQGAQRCVFCERQVDWGTAGYCGERGGMVGGIPCSRCSQHFLRIAATVPVYGVRDGPLWPGETMVAERPRPRAIHGAESIQTGLQYHRRDGYRNDIFVEHDGSSSRPGRAIRAAPPQQQQHHHQAAALHSAYGLSNGHLRASGVGIGHEVVAVSSGGAGGTRPASSPPMLLTRSTAVVALGTTYTHHGAMQPFPTSRPIPPLPSCSMGGCFGIGAAHSLPTGGHHASSSAREKAPTDDLDRGPPQGAIPYCDLEDPSPSPPSPSASSLAPCDAPSRYQYALRRRGHRQTEGQQQQQQQLIGADRRTRQRRRQSAAAVLEQEPHPMLQPPLVANGQDNAGYPVQDEGGLEGVERGAVDAEDEPDGYVGEEDGPQTRCWEPHGGSGGGGGGGGGGVYSNSDSRMLLNATADGGVVPRGPNDTPTAAATVVSVAAPRAAMGAPPAAAAAPRPPPAAARQCVLCGERMTFVRYRLPQSQDVYICRGCKERRRRQLAAAGAGAAAAAAAGGGGGGRAGGAGAGAGAFSGPQGAVPPGTPSRAVSDPAPHRSGSVVCQSNVADCSGSARCILSSAADGQVPQDTERAGGACSHRKTRAEVDVIIISDASDDSDAGADAGDGGNVKQSGNDAAARLPEQPTAHPADQLREPTQGARTSTALGDRSGVGSGVCNPHPIADEPAACAEDNAVQPPSAVQNSLTTTTTASGPSSAAAPVRLRGRKLAAPGPKPSGPSSTTAAETHQKRKMQDRGAAADIALKNGSPVQKATQRNAEVVREGAVEDGGGAIAHAKNATSTEAATKASADCNVPATVPPVGACKAMRCVVCGGAESDQWYRWEGRSDQRQCRGCYDRRRVRLKVRAQEVEEEEMSLAELAGESRAKSGTVRKSGGGRAADGRAADGKGGGAGGSGGARGAGGGGPASGGRRSTGGATGGGGGGKRPSARDDRDDGAAPQPQLKKRTEAAHVSSRPPAAAAATPTGIKEKPTCALAPATETEALPMINATNGFVEFAVRVPSVNVPAASTLPLRAVIFASPPPPAGARKSKLRKNSALALKLLKGKRKQQKKYTRLKKALKRNGFGPPPPLPPHALAVLQQPMPVFVPEGLVDPTPVGVVAAAVKTCRRRGACRCCGQGLQDHTAPARAGAGDRLLCQACVPLNATAAAAEATRGGGSAGGASGCGGRKRAAAKARKRKPRAIAPCASVEWDGEIAAAALDLAAAMLAAAPKADRGKR